MSKPLTLSLTPALYAAFLTANGILWETANVSPVRRGAVVTLAVVRAFDTIKRCAHKPVTFSFREFSDSAHEAVAIMTAHTCDRWVRVA